MLNMQKKQESRTPPETMFYDLSQQIQEDSCAYWYVYWDKEGFEISLLEKFEAESSKIAEAVKTRNLVLEMVIIPRSLNQIRMLAELNK